MTGQAGADYGWFTETQRDVTPDAEVAVRPDEPSLLGLGPGAAVADAVRAGMVQVAEERAERGQPAGEVRVARPASRGVMRAAVRHGPAVDGSGHEDTLGEHPTG
ncbi:hypothetical protein AB0L14_25945 [Streptomyces sp. NPDC052727]|uniref:hypothetical protein n=1 Tax=Streptomyces sp. NPDC052727 TaxID=3154854 RepID=UPI00343916DD